MPFSAGPGSRRYGARGVPTVAAPEGFESAGRSGSITDCIIHGVTSRIWRDRAERGTAPPGPVPEEPAPRKTAALGRRAGRRTVRAGSRNNLSEKLPITLSISGSDWAV